MLPTDCLHTTDIARTARLRWLWLRVEQLDALYDRAIAKGRRFEAMRLARLCYSVLLCRAYLGYLHRAL